MRRMWVYCPICECVVRSLDAHLTWHDRVGALLNRDIDVRWKSVTLPQVLVGTREELVTWPAEQGGPLPSSHYSVTPTVHLPSATLLGRTEVSIKAGSRTPEGCTVLFGTSLILPAGAVVEVVAVHYPLAAGGA